MRLGPEPSRFDFQSEPPYHGESFVAILPVADQRMPKANSFVLQFFQCFVNGRKSFLRCQAGYSQNSVRRLRTFHLSCSRTVPVKKPHVDSVIYSKNRRYGSFPVSPRQISQVFAIVLGARGYKTGEAYLFRKLARIRSVYVLGVGCKTERNST